MLIPFRKMQAQGNDFVFLELLETHECKLSLDELARSICDRRKGIGADGVVVLLADPEADARMIIHNADGSRAAMCGSALRCSAQLLNEMTGKSVFSIATDSGVKAASIISSSTVKSVEVNLGKPTLLESDVQVGEVQGSLINVGNLHFVSFWSDNLNKEMVFGPVLENHPYFTEAVNSEYVVIISRSEISVRVWERGCGATQACGTGAVASVFTGIHKGLLDDQVTVLMPGGKLQVRVTANGEFMLEGEVENVFNGVYRWKI